MSSIYLKPQDYATYGVPDATLAEVMQASALIDAYLDKPAGLIYDPVGLVMEANGVPISYMPERRHRNFLLLPYTPVYSILNVQYNNGYSPPQWRVVTHSSFDVGGTFWADITVPYTSQLIINYLAGYTYATLPASVKLACASLVKVFEEGFFSGNVKKLQAGKSSIEWFSNSHGLLDAGVQTLLAPYRRVFA